MTSVRFHVPLRKVTGAKFEKKKKSGERFLDFTLKLTTASHDSNRGLINSPSGGY